MEIEVLSQGPDAGEWRIWVGIQTQQHSLVPFHGHAASHPVLLISPPASREPQEDLIQPESLR